MIYKELINHLLNIASKYCKTVVYINKTRHSDQPNVPSYKMQIESEAFLNNGIIELNFRISSKAGDILDIQDNSMQYGVNIINEINLPQFFSVKSYDVVTFDEWSDNNEAGCRFTLYLYMVEPYDNCRTDI